MTDLTDGSGNSVDDYTYDVFGALRSGSPSATDFLFTGEQRDADSDLYYLRARYYDPAIGRFLTQDPVRSGNLYAYVRNRPTSLVDPSGLQAAEAAAPGTVVVLSCTAGAAASAGTSCVVGVVAVTGAIVVIGVCVAGAPCDELGGAIVDAGGRILGGVQSVAQEVADEVGDWLGFGKKSKPKEEFFDPRDPSLRNIGHEWTRPTLQNFPWPWGGCRHFRDWRKRALCWLFVAGGISGAISESLPILTGEKPPPRP